MKQSNCLKLADFLSFSPFKFISLSKHTVVYTFNHSYL
ncbi:hypothetical protein CSUI_000841 [Cystoisospora suis]|uniref:Uncharacterized protein n=1 Tax=Cystoisospora suis TaxID=483139 RepID=A0A2C6LEN4_9APIC|nr:hypothetical protein CSUI_000841 [Cystoisospora suis]